MNGMAFPTKPYIFDLNELECRLLAPRIAFQKLIQAPSGKQLKIFGNVVSLLVNVPADVTNTVSMLPRLSSEAGTIKINLKRKLQYKSSAISLNVRPHKVIKAALWLMNNTHLYKDEGIVFNNEWSNKFIAEIQGNESCDNLLEEQLTTTDKISCNVDSQALNDEDSLSEDEAEIPAGVTDTMLTATDF